MYKQGRSLGKQIARECKTSLDRIIHDAADRGVNVWFLGRDCFAIYSAYKKIAPNVRYLKGLNRECAGKLDRRGLIHTYLYELGVREDDVLIDSGFRGSIFDMIVEPTVEYTAYISNLSFYLLSAVKDCAYIDLGVKRSIVLALEHSPKPEVVEWDSETRRPIVYKIARTGHRTWGDRRENACGLDQVSSFVSGFVAGYNM